MYESSYINFVLCPHRFSHQSICHSVALELSALFHIKKVYTYTSLKNDALVCDRYDNKNKMINDKKRLQDTENSKGCFVLCVFFIHCNMRGLLSSFFSAKSIQYFKPNKKKISKKNNNSKFIADVVSSSYYPPLLSIDTHTKNNSNNNKNWQYDQTIDL